MKKNLSREALENFVDAVAKFIVEENLLEEGASSEEAKERLESTGRGIREVQLGNAVEKQR